MRFALGALRWPPASFWAATTAELRLAVDGYVEARGGKRQQSKASELRDLMDAHAYRTKSIKDDPKAVVIGGGRKGR